MKLKAVYKTKEEVPEKYADLYTEKDGQFILTEVEDIKTQADVDNVQKALKAERQLKKDLESKLALFEGVEADGLREQLDELARLRTTKGKVDDSQIESIVAERLKLDKAKHEREIEKYNKELQDAQAKVKSLVNERNTGMIERKLREVASGKVNDSAMNDVLFRASLFEVSEDGSVVTKDGVGVTPGQEPSAWLEDSLKTNSHWQLVSSGVGAKGGNGSSGIPKDGRSTIREIINESVKFND